MLLPLHATLVMQVAPWAVGVLLLNHLLLFSLWRLGGFDDQTAPLLALAPSLAAVVLVVTLGHSAWFTGLWIIFLTGAVAGRGLLVPGCRIGYGAITLYLLLAGLVGVLPLDERHAPILGDRASMLVLNAALAIAMLASLIPESSKNRPAAPPPRVIDLYLCGSVVALLALSLCLGFSVATNLSADQPRALLLTGAGVFVLLLSMAAFVNPLELFRRAKYKPGQPAPNRAAEIVAIANQLLRQPGQKNEGTFLAHSIAVIGNIDFVRGGAWQAEGASGEFGQLDGHRVRVATDTIQLDLYADRLPAVEECGHIEIVLRLIEELYRSQRRERELRHQSHLETIYETGARITHDAKNLLQSLQTLNTAVLASKPDEAQQVQQLLQKQLPQLTQRLRATLDKLQAPQDVSTTFQVARIWWEKLKARYRQEEVTFTDNVHFDQLIPRDLFDRVAENLLENARRKRQSERDLRITASLLVSDREIELTVTDTGSPVPARITRGLFQHPVDSSAGYGIALYQAAMQAARQKFQLLLRENSQGKVSFVLRTDLK